MCVFRSIFIGVSMIFSTTPRANLLWRLMATYWILGLVEVVGDLRVKPAQSPPRIFHCFSGGSVPTLGECPRLLQRKLWPILYEFAVWIDFCRWQKTTQQSIGQVADGLSPWLPYDVFFTALCGFEPWIDEPFLILI